MTDVVEQPRWWRDAVIYQIYTRSFFDSNGDGVGDLEGVIAKLDYLADLGVDVLWLSPLHPTPNIDYGYDATDYFDVAPEMGTLATFDRLVAEAGRRGLRIMMDLVLDYTSTAHPWFVQARSSRTSPYHDWYVWADGDPDRPPNDWTGFFWSGGAWTFDVSTRRWYLHYFTAEQAELNWANPALRAKMHEVMRFWLDRGIAGYRLDVIPFLSKPATLDDLPETARTRPGTHYANGPRLHEYLQEMRREVFDRYPGAVALGEGFDVSVEQSRDYLAPDRGELDLMFLFELASLAFARTGDPVARPQLPDIRAIIARIDTVLTSFGGWPTNFLGNHDVSRMVNVFADARPEYRAASAKMLGTLLLTLRGTPVLYQGDEIGMANAQFARLADLRDVAAMNAWRVTAQAGGDLDELLARFNETGRDTARTPIHWSAAPQAGFTTGEPWIGLAADWRETNVDAQRGRPGSVLEHYRALLALRRREAALRSGDFRLVDTPNPTTLAFERTGAARRFRTLLNWSDRSVDEPIESGWTVETSVSSGVAAVAGELRLEPYAAVLLAR